MPIKREYGVTPFWFWNDQLCEEEILRQIASMDHVGVGGFVLHPRVGLPRDQGWMSDSLLGYMRIACAEAKRRGMRVILYDEGMYPSGSSSGQVVAENPAYQTRCIRTRPGAGLEPGENLLWQQRAADGSTLSYVDAPLPSVIRGLHYRDEASASEETPPAADLLNPEAMQCFLRLVHDRYYAKLGEWFGDTITGIFTDEPSLLGRAQVHNILPGTSGLLAHVYRLTGVDFTPLLPALFDATHPEHERLKATWWKACRLRLEETYYAPMSDWCHRHGLELMGHPELPTDLALQRFLSVPGQDCVWRWNVPGPTATQGAQSTNPKCASSAAAHLGRPRNSNEFCGAYGHELTFEEMKWLADYLLVRGQNWLMPHAYYYSIRGPRRDERPPDVGFNSKWPDRLAQFNAYCEQLSQRIAQSRQVVHVAVVVPMKGRGHVFADRPAQHGFEPRFLRIVRLIVVVMAPGHVLTDTVEAQPGIAAAHRPLLCQAFEVFEFMVATRCAEAVAHA